MPFIHRLHISLALGEVGTDLFGIVALFWNFDCLTGAYLNSPSGRRKNSKRPAYA